LLLNFQKNNKKHASFKCKKFTVEQSETAMKVGTDGVLLGAWADFSNARNILDIGTGTGLIALMAAQRSNAEITAIEIEKNAAIQALSNFQNSPWSLRLTLETISLADFFLQNTAKFDSIVCNPPYFSNSLKNPDSDRTLARHNDTLPLDDLLKLSEQMLSPAGKLSIILPGDTKNAIFKSCEKYGLFVNKLTEVKPNPHKEIKRILLEISKKNNTLQQNILCIELAERHCYSDDYINLTKDFYLKM